jgi:hypothetical protein
VEKERVMTDAGPGLAAWTLLQAMLLDEVRQSDEVRRSDERRSDEKRERIKLLLMTATLALETQRHHPEDRESALAALNDLLAELEHRPSR